MTAAFIMKSLNINNLSKCKQSSFTSYWATRMRLHIWTWYRKFKTNKQTALNLGKEKLQKENFASNFFSIVVLIWLIFIHIFSLYRDSLRGYYKLHNINRMVKFLTMSKLVLLPHKRKINWEMSCWDKEYGLYLESKLTEEMVD